MQIPILFALYAANDVKIWTKLINRSLVHKTYGLGKIEKIEKKDEQIIITCKFNDNLKNEGFANFTQQAFAEGFFSELELLYDFDKYLLENEGRLIKRYLDKEDELQRIKDEFQRNKDELEEINRNNRKDTYVNTCYSCKRDVLNSMKRCNSCGWYICDSCGACGCNYGK